MLKADVKWHMIVYVNFTEHFMGSWIENIFTYDVPIFTKY